MGLMTLEAALSRPVTRGEMFDFARRGRDQSGNRPPRRPTSQGPIPPSDHPKGRVMGRRAVLGWIAGATATVGAYILF